MTWQMLTRIPVITWHVEWFTKCAHTHSLAFGSVFETWPHYTFQPNRRTWRYGVHELCVWLRVSRVLAWMPPLPPPILITHFNFDQNSYSLLLDWTNQRRGCNFEWAFRIEFNNVNRSSALRIASIVWIRAVTHRAHNEYDFDANQTW